MRRRSQLALFFALLLGAATGCDSTGRAYASAEQANTIDAYNAFITQHPDHALADSARQRIEGLRWQDASSTSDVAVVEQFINDYPASAYNADARARLTTLQRENAYRCSSGMQAGPFMLLAPGSTNISFMVTPRSSRDAEGPYGTVCGLRIRQNLTVVLVEDDGLLRLDKEGIQGVSRSDSAVYVTKRVGSGSDAPILFVRQRS